MMATYRDLDLSFATHPITGDVVMKNDTKAVLQSVRNLLMINLGEVLWEPEIGGGIMRLMFETNDLMLRMQLHDRITNTIMRFEPRIEIINLDIQMIDGNYNAMALTLTFMILNNPDPVTETIPIRRLR